jgi:hypothetical protein
LTGVEVLVLVVILLLVIGVILATIPRARESASRAQCAENLKQMGTGVRLFHDAKNFLPASRIADGYATWAVQLAPYLKLGKTDALARWDVRKPYGAQPEAVRTAQVPLFFCPSRRLPPQVSAGGDGAAAALPPPGALGDYGCSSGSGSPQRPWTTAQADGAIIVGEVLERSDDLILNWRGRTDLKSLTRGLSQTILVGEKHVPLDHFGQVQFGDGPLFDGDPPASAARVGGPGFGLAPAPDAPFHDNFGSYHPGLCQFLMADGGVRPLANAISEDVLGRLTTRGQ